MTDELETQLAKRFIQRRDVKAIQFDNGSWSPDNFVSHNRIIGLRPEYAPLGFKMQHLRDHISGDRTYGHYLLDADSVCRVFAFDIDLEEEGHWVDISAPTFPLHSGHPRSDWLDRKHPGRPWYKLQMRQLAHKFLKVMDGLGTECAAAYSGGKGIHVYGFTGPLPAKEVREMANLVIEAVGEFIPSRGQNFFKHVDPDPTVGYENFSIEIFPKQESLDGKDLGNLMRLPMGKNRKNPRDETFFLDVNAPLALLVPHKNPVRALELGRPFHE